MYSKVAVLVLVGLALSASIPPNHASGLKLKWGILSAGRISYDFIKSMKNFDTSEHEIVAIASRDKNRGEMYAKKFNIPRVYNNYLDLAKDPEVNAIYVSTINPYHFAAVKLMLEHKKAVLCEKPLVMTPEDARELFELAKKQNVFLMEALWSKFLPSYIKTKELIDKGEIGDIELIQANFLLPMGDVERLRHVKYGGGIMLDIGIYTFNALMMPLNYSRPVEIKAVGRRHGLEGPDRTVSIALRFPNDVIGNILISSQIPRDAYTAVNHVLYVGSKGYIKLPAPINGPIYVELNGRKINTDFRDKQTDYNHMHSAGLRFQAEEMRQRMMKGEVTSEVMPPEHSIMLSELTNEVLKQLGIKFPPTDRSYDFKQIV